MTAPHRLVVRLDSLGDVLICGPAVRAVAAGAGRTTMLVSPLGAPTAQLLPGVDEVIIWDCPWITATAPCVDAADIAAVVGRIRAARIDEAVVLTSFHQSALPTALLLRLAGVRRIAAVSDDYPGTLLDVRIPEPADAPEPERMLAVARSAGYALPAGDAGRLAVTVPATLVDVPDAPYLVVHPGVSAPARAYPKDSWRQVVAELTTRGHTVLVTGSKEEAELTATVALGGQPPGVARDCGGAFDVAELAAVLRGSAAVVVANTGPAHLAAAVDTPVVSLFAPVVPVGRWAPYGVASVVLGDQHAPCRDTRAWHCPVPGHPCLMSVAPDDVAAAVTHLTATVTA